MHESAFAVDDADASTLHLHQLGPSASWRVQVRVLKKHPSSKEVADGDVFRYVPDFTHPLVRVRINQIQVQESADESKRTNEQARPPTSDCV
jgi:hypothetical protein